MTEEVRDDEQVVISLENRKSIQLKIKQAHGDAFIRFKRLKNNEYMKLMIDAEKRSADSEKRSGNWERLAEEQALVLSKIIEVENLRDDEEQVTLEALKAGDVSSDIVDLILSGFWGIFWTEKGRKVIKEAKEKNEQEKGEDLPQG